jgi:hypothetical protein
MKISVDGLKAKGLNFLICPFVGFENPSLGSFLIKPVKPRECKESTFIH